MCQIFMKAMLDSAYTTMSRRVGRQVVNLEPGEFIFGRNQWAEELGLTPKVVRGRIKKLEKNGVIWATQRANEFTVFKFINWVSYQELGNAEGPTTGPTKGQPGANQGPHKKHSNIKEEEKKKNIDGESSASPSTPSNPNPVSTAFEADSMREASGEHAESNAGTDADSMPLSSPSPNPSPEKKGTPAPDPDSELDHHFENPNVRTLVQQAIERVHLTRKCGKAQPSIISRFIRELRQYEDWKVGTGLTRYLEGEYYLDGKGERYALGIVRNCTPKDWQEVVGKVRDGPREGSGHEQSTVQPRNYKEAKDAERRSRALRLIQQQEASHAQQGSDQEGVGQADHCLPLSGTG